VGDGYGVTDPPRNGRSGGAQFPACRGRQSARRCVRRPRFTFVHRGRAVEPARNVLGWRGARSTWGLDSTVACGVEIGGRAGRRAEWEGDGARESPARLARTTFALCRAPPPKRHPRPPGRPKVKPLHQPEKRNKTWVRSLRTRWPIILTARRLSGSSKTLVPSFGCRSPPWRVSNRSRRVRQNR